MSFKDDIKKFKEKAEKAALAVFQGTALDMFGRIVKRTPVGNPSLWLYLHPERGYVDFLTWRDAPEGYVGGRLRANWQVNINKKPTGMIDNADKNGTIANVKAKVEISLADLGDSIYIINNLPYAERVEDGWSSQAPAGMVKVTVAEFKNIVDRNVK